MTGVQTCALPIYSFSQSRYQLQQKKDPKSFCDEISKNFIDLAKKLNLSNTDFIRTTEDRHKKTVSKLWNILEEKNEIYISKYSGWYSVSDEAFYNEDEIETKSDAKISKVSGSKVEWMEEESYFFRLSKWQKPLLKYYEDNFRLTWHLFSLGQGKYKSTTSPLSWQCGRLSKILNQNCRTQLSNLIVSAISIGSSAL